MLHFRGDDLLFKYPVIWGYDFYRVWKSLIISLMLFFVLGLYLTYIDYKVDVVSAITGLFFISCIVYEIFFENSHIYAYCNYSIISIKEEQLLKKIIIISFISFVSMSTILINFFWGKCINAAMDFENILYPAQFFAIALVCKIAFFDFFFGGHSPEFIPLSQIGKIKRKIETLHSIPFKGILYFLYGLIEHIFIFIFIAVVLPYIFYILYMFTKLIHNIMPSVLGSLISNSWISTALKKTRSVFYEILNYIFFTIDVDKNSALIFVNKSMLFICSFYLIYYFVFLIKSGIKFKILYFSDEYAPKENDSIDYSVIPHTFKVKGKESN